MPNAGGSGDARVRKLVDAARLQYAETKPALSREDTDDGLERLRAGAAPSRDEPVPLPPLNPG